MSYENIPEFIESNNILGINAMRLERKAAQVVGAVGNALERLILHVELELDPNSKQYSDEPHTLVLPTMPARVLRVTPPDQQGEGAHDQGPEQDAPTTIPVIAKEPEHPIALANPDKYHETDPTGVPVLTTNPAEADQIGTAPADTREGATTTDEHGTAYAVAEPKATTPGLIASATNAGASKAPAASTPQADDVTVSHLGQATPTTPEPLAAPAVVNTTPEQAPQTATNAPSSVSEAPGALPLDTSSEAFASSSEGAPDVSAEASSIPEGASGSSTGTSTSGNGKGNGKKGSTSTGTGTGTGTGFSALPSLSSSSSFSPSGTDGDKGDATSGTGTEATAGSEGKSDLSANG
jgi:hypothetical protein